MSQYFLPSAQVQVVRLISPIMPHGSNHANHASRKQSCPATRSPSTVFLSSQIARLSVQRHSSETKGIIRCRAGVGGQGRHSGDGKPVGPDCPLEKGVGGGIETGHQMPGRRIMKRWSCTARSPREDQALLLRRHLPLVPTVATLLLSHLRGQ